MGGSDNTDGGTEHERDVLRCLAYEDDLDYLRDLDRLREEHGRPQSAYEMRSPSPRHGDATMRIATIGSTVILQRAVGGHPAGAICQVVGRELHDDARGLEFVLKPRVGGGSITLDEANLVEGGYPFVLLNY